MKIVLIADDSLFIRTSLKDVLKKGNYQILEATNGKEAVELYQDYKPDIALLDITMPEMDGMEALRAIKVIDENAKVIMCTAMGQQSFVQEAIKLGVLDFIVKPYKPERILMTLKKHLNS